jgi:acyl-CoA reductase-like NAD-dependent aldehyde dehydrogenase
METLKPHVHNGSDSQKLVFKDAIENAPQSAVTPVSGTAGATYTATERAIINDTTTALNDLITKLQALGILE